MHPIGPPIVFGQKSTKQSQRLNSKGIGIRIELIVRILSAIPPQDIMRHLCMRLTGVIYPDEM